MAGFFLVMLIITSVIYPAVITAAANVAFGHEANGSVIVARTALNMEAPFWPRSLPETSIFGAES